MKTRTAAFDVAWANRRVRKAAYKVTYRRRYWNGAAFVLEASPKTVPMREIERVTGTNWKFDVPLANRIQPSNVTLVLRNTGYKWLPSNTASGVWRRSAATTVLGYDPVGSEFTVHYALYVDEEMTAEWLPIFTGIVTDDLQFDSESGTVTIPLVGKAEALLEQASADRVCTSIADQETDPPEGDGTTERFALLTSVWRAQNVRVASTPKTQGTHYKLDNLNDAENPAEIVFEAGAIPALGQEILGDVDRWHINKSVSELVGLLCDQAGIGSGEREIEEPIFSGVASFVKESTKANFDAGTLIQNIDTSRHEGRIIKKWTLVDDFSAGLGNWTKSWNSFTGTEPSTSGGYLRLQTAGVGLAQGAGYAQVQRAYDGGIVGTWFFKMTVTLSGGSSEGSASVGFASTVGNAGYTLAFNSSGVFLKANAVTILSLGALPSGEHTWRITRTVAGAMEVFKDGVSVGSVTNTTVASANAIGIGVGCPASSLLPQVALSLTDFYFSESITTDATSAAEAIHDSAVQDLLATPTSVGPLTVTEDLNGGTVTYWTATSADGVSFDAWVQTNASLVPQSTLRRYWKVRKKPLLASGSFVSPIVGPVQLNYSTSQLFIASADFTGLTCLQAVYELGKLAGMEIGSKGDGTFFFRNRSTSTTSHLTLSQKNAVLSVSSYRNGYRDVKNVGQVRYGKSGPDGYYFAEYKASDAGESSPTSAARFGERVITMDLTRFIFANNAQVAVAIARKLYENNYLPKRRLQLPCRIIPHLDLADRVTISFHDSPLIEKAIFGDPFQKGFPPIGPNPKTLARNILMKVVGHSMDVMRSRSVLDLEEVLS